LEITSFSFLFELGFNGFGILLSILAVGAAIIGSGWLSMCEQSRKGCRLIGSLIGFVADYFVTSASAQAYAV
jgi:hypothetical protein